MQLYVWDRCFLLRAPSLVLPALAKPRRRLSATLLLAGKRPFAIEGVGAEGQRYRGVILAPNVPRFSLDATDADLTILDAGIDTAAYQQLRPCLAPRAARVLNDEELARLAPMLAPADAPLDCAQAGTLFNGLIAALGDAGAKMPPFDPRIEKVIAVIERYPLDELSLPLLARAAGISETRLRILFQRDIGCAPAQYARWAKTWQAIRAWRPGMQFTEAAHRAGFYDLAHIDHTLKELFGMTATAMATAQGVLFRHCGL